MSNNARSIRLEDLVEPDRGITYGIVQPGSYVKDGVPIVRVRDIRNGRINCDNPLRVDPAISEKHKRTQLRGGEILLTLVGTVGETAIVPSGLAGWNTARAVAVIPVKQYPGAKWVEYVLRNKTAQQYFDSRLNTTVQATLNLRDVAALEVPMPDDGTRQAITEVLGALDDKIELNRQMNRTLEEMAAALFKSWFVDFDPVKAKAEGRKPFGMDDETAALFPDRFVEVDGELIPAGWQVSSLKDQTTKIGSGATPRGGKAAYIDDGIALIRSQNVYDSNFVWDGLARITDDAAAKLAGVTVEKDDVLLNITGASILRTCVVDPSVLPARVNQHVAIVRAKENVPARYIHAHLLNPSTKNYLMGMNAGGSREAVTKVHIESVPILLPLRQILDCYKNMVQPLFATVESNVVEIRALADIRDTLLPKLLSGEIRLTQTENTSKEAV